MGHFKESSSANLLINNGTILITITITIYTRKTTTISTHTIVAKKKPSPFFLPVVYNKEGIPVSGGLESSFRGQIGVELNFQSIGAPYRCGGTKRAAQ